LVVQSWLAAHGDRRDVVIGVKPAPGVFAAHAWIDGHEPGSATDYAEIHRIPPP